MFVVRESHVVFFCCRLRYDVVVLFFAQKLVTFQAKKLLKNSLLRRRQFIIDVRHPGRANVSKADLKVRSMAPFVFAPWTRMLRVAECRFGARGLMQCLFGASSASRSGASSVGIAVGCGTAVCCGLWLVSVVICEPRTVNNVLLVLPRDSACWFVFALPSHRTWFSRRTTASRRPLCCLASATSSVGTARPDSA